MCVFFFPGRFSPNKKTAGGHPASNIGCVFLRGPISSQPGPPFQLVWAPFPISLGPHFQSVWAPISNQFGLNMGEHKIGLNFRTSVVASVPPQEVLGGGGARMAPPRTPRQTWTQRPRSDPDWIPKADPLIEPRSTPDRSQTGLRSTEPRPWHPGRSP